MTPSDKFTSTMMTDDVQRAPRMPAARMIPLDGDCCPFSNNTYEMWNVSDSLLFGVFMAAKKIGQEV